MRASLRSDWCCPARARLLRRLCSFHGCVAAYHLRTHGKGHHRETVLGAALCLSGRAKGFARPARGGAAYFLPRFPGSAALSLGRGSLAPAAARQKRQAQGPAEAHTPHTKGGTP